MEGDIVCSGCGDGHSRSSPARNPANFPLTAEERLQSALAIMRGTDQPHQNAGGCILDVKQF
jgi:hypothetical protein